MGPNANLITLNMRVIAAFFGHPVIAESRFKSIIKIKKLMNITAANSKLIAFKLNTLESMTRLQLISDFMVS